MILGFSVEAEFQCQTCFAVRTVEIEDKGDFGGITVKCECGDETTIEVRIDIG